MILRLMHLGIVSWVVQSAMTSYSTDVWARCQCETAGEEQGHNYGVTGYPGMEENHRFVFILPC